MNFSSKLTIEMLSVFQDLTDDNKSNGLVVFPVTWIVRF